MQVKHLISGFVTGTRIDLDAATEAASDARKRKVMASTLSGFLTAAVLPSPDVAAAIEPSRYLPPVSAVSGFITNPNIPVPTVLPPQVRFAPKSNPAPFVTAFNGEAIELTELDDGVVVPEPSSLSGFVTEIEIPRPELAPPLSQIDFGIINTVSGFITNAELPAPVIIEPQVRLPPASNPVPFITVFDGQSIELSELDDAIKIPEPSLLSGFITEVSLPEPDIAPLTGIVDASIVNTVSGFVTDVALPTPTLAAPVVALPPKSPVAAFVTTFTSYGLVLESLDDPEKLPNPSSLSAFITSVELPEPELLLPPVPLPIRPTVSGFVTLAGEILPVEISLPLWVPMVDTVSGFVTSATLGIINEIDPVELPDYLSSLSGFVTDIELPEPTIVSPVGLIDFSLVNTVSGFITDRELPDPDIAVPVIRLPPKSVPVPFITLADINNIVREALDEIELPGSLSTLSGFITELDPPRLIPDQIGLPDVVPPVSSVMGFITDTVLPAPTLILDGQPSFPPESNVIWFITATLIELQDINDLYPDDPIPDTVSLLSGFITRTFPKEAYDNVIENLADFLGGVGRYVRIYGNGKPVRGQPFRFEAHVSDWALEDGVPLTAPVLEVGYFQNGERVVLHRAQMNNYQTDAPIAIGSTYYLDVPMPADKSIHSIEATVSIFPEVASELGGLLAEVVQSSDPLSLTHYVDLQKAALVTPQIDTMNLPLDSAQPKLDVLGMVTKGLLQFK